MNVSVRYFASILLVGLMVSVLPGCGAKGDSGSVNGKNSDDSPITGIFGHEKTQKCTWTDEDGNSGTTYIDGEKFRTHVEATDDGKDFVLDSISDGEWIYSWSDGSMKMATKMNIKQMEEMSGDDEYGGDYSGADFGEPDFEKMEDDDNVNFKCEKWLAKSSTFVPPSDIEFTDLSKQMEGMGNMLDGMDPEEICGALSGEDKEGCLEQF